MNHQIIPAIGLPLLLLTACAPPDSTRVVGPFYAMYIDIPEEMALFRCPRSSDECAGDGLPEATVYAAGGDDRYVVVVRHPRIDNVTDRGVSEYYYFARIKTERGGWGNNPEHIIGPLTKQQFDAAKQKFGLPDFLIVFDYLK